MIETEKLSIALSKGRILKPTIRLFDKCGIDLSEIIENDRKLIFELPSQNYRFILAKPADVPVYVENGVADLGIVGKDVLLDSQADFYELLDLGIGYCRMVVAKLKGTNPEEKTVASKYPEVARKYYQEKGKQVNVIKLHGSVELAPLLKLSDVIVDLVSTGKTLKENNLEEMETITEITTRLIANRGSYQLKSMQIDDLVNLLETGINTERRQKHASG